MVREVKERPELTVARSERKKTGANIKDVFSSRSRKKNEREPTVSSSDKH